MAVGTYALQTAGFAAVAEGNVIIVGDLHIGVLEACSGLECRPRSSPSRPPPP